MYRIIKVATDKIEIVRAHNGTIGILSLVTD